jgi:hypothetical protein
LRDREAEGQRRGDGGTQDCAALHEDASLWACC